MTIIGLDPGTEQSAFVMWDGERVTQHDTVDNGHFLWMLSRAWSVAQLDAVLVIEKIESMGMAVGVTTFETVFVSGRFAEAWSPRRWERLTRRAVKLHLCGSMRAKDANVRQALIDKIGPVGTKKQPGPLYGVKGHEFAALAVAVTYAETRQ